MPVTDEDLEHLLELPLALAVLLACSIALEECGEAGILPGQDRREPVAEPFQVVLVELIEDDGFRQLQPGRTISAAHLLGRLPLAEAGAGEDGVEGHPSASPVFAQQAALSVAQVRQNVVFGGEERRLAVPDQSERAHRPAPSLSWSRRMPRSQRS